MKILIIRFSSAGDIILTSLLVRRLRARFADAEIHFLTKEEFRQLVIHSPHINRVITIPQGARTCELIQTKSEMIAGTSGGYDLVLDLHNSLRSRYFRIGLGFKLAVIQKPTLKKWLLVKHKINRLQPIVPIAERYLHVAEPFGVENDTEGLELFLGQTFAPVLPLDERPTFCLAPGARHATKQWPAEYFTALGNLLVDELQARIVLLGAPGERDLCVHIASGIDGDTVNLAGRTNWLESAAATDACDVVVTNDSAIAHIASARKRPVVAVFGSTIQEFGFAPYGTQSVVIENQGLYCRPCTTIGREKCPERHFRCMMDVVPIQVFQAVMSLFLTKP